MTLCRATFFPTYTMLLLDPISIGSLQLRNRLVMPPMCMYSAQDGLTNDFHLVHYATRATGGVGLIIIEATGILPNGRISDQCLGLWKDEQIEPLRRVVEACHRQGAKVAVQLAHAGRKCVASGVSRIVAPSRLRFSDAPEYREPDELSPLEIETIAEAFGSAAARAALAGVDALEVHAAHGYLIHQFLSPLSNQRRDDYGGSLANRTRILSRVLQAVRREWAAPKSLLLRVSASDYAIGGLDVPQLAEIVSQIRSYIDMLHVSSGGLLPIMPPQSPGFQVPFAKALRAACAVPVIAVGLITSAEQAEAILQAQQADLVAMGRELLRNPYLPLTAAKTQHAPALHPHQYERAFS